MLTLLREPTPGVGTRCATRVGLVLVLRAEHGGQIKGGKTC